MNAIYVMVVESFDDRHEVDRLLRGPEPPQTEEQMRETEEQMREEWGTTPEAVEAARAAQMMFAQTG